MKRRFIRSAVALCAAAAPVVGLVAGAGAATNSANGCTVTANKPAFGGGVWNGTGSGDCGSRHATLWAWWYVSQSNVPGGPLTFNIVQGNNTPSSISDSLDVATVDRYIGACPAGASRTAVLVVQAGDKAPVTRVQSEPLTFSCK